MLGTIGPISILEEVLWNQMKMILTGIKQKMNLGWNLMTQLSETLISKNLKKNASEEMAKEAMMMVGALVVLMVRVPIC